MFKYVIYIFSKTVLMMVGILSIKIGSVYWNDNGEIDPLMIFLLFVGAMILTIWNEIQD